MIIRRLARAAAALAGLAALLATGGAVAQDAASTYRVGEHVQLKPTPWQDVWEDGVVEEVLAQGDQVVIKSPSVERAFVMKDVRHLPAAPPAPDLPPLADQAASPAPALTLASNAGGDRMGERVSVAVGGSCCYDGTIIGVGSGSVAGFYLIHFDNPASHDQYANPKYVYARGTRVAPPAGTNGRGHIHCVMGTIGGKPVCLPTAAPG